MRISLVSSIDSTETDLKVGEASPLVHYYMERTSDLRKNKELVFVSFKQGFDIDISPATISSWVKQTVILCYELSDQEALTVHQVKAYDVRSFAASKAFQSGLPEIT